MNSRAAQPTFSPGEVLPVAEMRANLSQLRATCPVSQVAPGMVFVSRYDDVRQTLRDPGTFSSASNMLFDPALPKFVTQLDPPEHTELRNLLRGSFDRAAMVEAAPWVQAVVESLIDAVAEQGHAELVGDVAMPLTESVISRLVGIPLADGPQLARWSLAITAMMPKPRFDGEEWQRIEEYVAGKIRERRELSDPPDDMLTRLIDGRLGGQPLSDREVAFHTWLLFVGGLETTSYTLCMTMYQLLVDPERWQRVVADRSVIGSAVEEGIRYASALRYIQREATSATTIAGCPIERGDTVFLGLESANFDESTFDDPEAFDLDRANSGRHVAFGHGAHTCIGAALARTEIAAALNRLADRLPGLRLAPGFEYEDVESPMFCGPKRLDVVW